MKKRLYVLSFIFVVIDQFIKIIISNTIKLNTSINLIPNFFYLSNVHNDGAAFSIMSGNRFFLLLITVLALIIIYFCFLKNNNMTKLETLLNSMLLGGIIGNFIDRIIYGYVIDYLEFNIFGYNFPIFNFADICIVLSVIGILINSIREDLCKSLKLKKKQAE